MSRYFCPYCHSRYQFDKTKNNGVLICGLCGDPLVKKSFINSRGIIGIVVASAFIAPLLVMISFVVNDFVNKKLPNNSQSAVFIVIGMK
tara:strand:+ start:66 stop:332 length:267 start_codon:yes stop_codon:yes gene_type:complete